MAAPRFLSDLAGTLRSQFRIKPAAVPGAPTTGTHASGELHMDSTGVVWVCQASGTPGTWSAVGGIGETSSYPTGDLTLTAGISYVEYSGGGNNTLTLMAANTSTTSSVAVTVKNRSQGTWYVSAKVGDTIELTQTIIPILSGQARRLVANKVSDWGVT